MSFSAGVPWIGKKRIRCSGGGSGLTFSIRSSSVSEVLSSMGVVMVGPQGKKKPPGFRLAVFRDSQTALSRLPPPVGWDRRRSRRSTASSWFRILPQNHFPAPAERNPGPARLICYHGVPNLGGPPEVHRRRAAADRALAGGADEVRLELDRRESPCAFRQVGEAAVAAARVGERDDRRGVQVA